jgi:predicted membrane-bound spermidine synthase
MVNKGRAINILVVTCNGNDLILDINGENQFSIKDEQFKEGEIGLIAGSFEESGVDIFFDNFTVIQP